MTGDGMDTTGVRLTSGELKEWLAGLLRGGKRVVAPVEDAGLRLFRPIEFPDQICLANGKTRLSPKDALFPKTEALFSYAVRGDQVTLAAPPIEPGEQVLFAVRPCDVAGSSGWTPSSWATPGTRTTRDAARARSSSPWPARRPSRSASARRWGGTGGRGGQRRPGHGRGGRLDRPPPDGEGRGPDHGPRGAARPLPGGVAQARAGVARAEASLTQRPVAREWAAVLEANFDLPLWEAVGQRCVGCSICNFVCPSCSCFDVQDGGNVFCGERCRSWDSCTFATFTRHGSGHNPRPTQPSRYRQRVLHKFAYYPALQGGEFMCVGCGRCVRHCPVGLGIYQSVNQVMTAVQEGGDAGS